MQPGAETRSEDSYEAGLRATFGDLADLQGLPTPPVVANEIIELLQDPEADYKRLIDSIMKDPALVAKILKTANSAMFSRRREVTNIAQALLTMGQVATATLALSFTLVSGVKGAPAGHLDLTRYWRRSLVSAVAARLLGNAVTDGHAEQLYLAGLLQDIGMLVIDLTNPEFYADGDDAHDKVVAAEQRAFEADHAGVGGWLLKHWGLPESIYLPVRYSHCAEPPAVAGCAPEDIACVALSGRIAELLIGTATEREIALLAADAERLGLSQERALALLNELSDQIPLIESQFDISIIDTEEKLAIINKAHEVLMDVNLRTLQEIAVLQRNAEELQKESERDTLTGLQNRDYLDRELGQWAAQAAKHEFPLSVAFMDLDGFKAVNDRLGHAAGDEVLKVAAALLAEQVRSTDILARFGGDEFVLVLGGETLDDALIVCERIERAFADQNFSVAGENVGVGISIGLAELGMTQSRTESELLKLADMALLEAKRQGKNRVCVYAAPQAGV